MRWLRKAACVSQSVKRDLISSLALDRPQVLSSLGLVGWLWPRGTFWRLPFGLEGTRKQESKKALVPLCQSVLLVGIGEGEGRQPAEGRGGVGGQPTRPAALLPGV